MTPIIQTITEPGKGNCLAACIASILDIDISVVPDLQCGANYKGLCEFLARFNLVPIWIHSDLGDKWVGYYPEYCIVIGPSPRLSSKHAVVAKPNGWGYEIVHDPHPEGGGIAGEISSVIYLGSVLRS